MTYPQVKRQVFDYPTSEEAIENIEKFINAKVPEDYREFILQYNGAFIEPNRFKYPTISGCSGSHDKVDTAYRSNEIALIYGHNMGKPEPSGSVQETIRLLQSFPEKLLPIAITSNGDEICLSIRGDDYGNVYIWCHGELGDDDEELDECYNVYFISNSFKEFLSLLF